MATNRRPVVTLTTDWGLRDPSPAICHGVVLNIAPDATVIDISHEIEKYNIRHGALMLWSALPYMPVGAHVCVIDPGVGTSRRPIAIETGRGDFLVGPDNGVLIPGAERIGGITRAHLIDNERYRLPVVSATFHGRDLFTPAAAHLATGVNLHEIGPPIDPSSLEKLEWPEAEVTDGLLRAMVIYRDTFGNVKLNGVTADLLAALDGINFGDMLAVEAGGTTHSVPWVRTFGDVATGRLLLYEDSYGRLCIAQNQGDAAAALSIEEGAGVRISHADAREVQAAE